MPIQVSDAAVIANDEVVMIVPNTLVYTEGFGEYKVRGMSIGGGKTEQVFSEDLESAMSKINFELPTTIENIKLARQWKALKNQNVFQIAGSTPDGNVTKVFTQAAVVNDPEIGIGTETSIPIEIMSNSAI